MLVGWKRSPLTFTVHGIALASLLSGAAAFGLRDHTVVVSVDGATRTLHTYGRHVGDVLARAGIRLGPHDVVSPGLSAQVSDGSHVSVARARPLTVVVDGHEQTSWATQPTVGAAVQALGVRLRGAYMSVAADSAIPTSGTTVVVDLPQRVTIVADGRHRVVASTSLTVADLLASRHVVLRALDRVSVPLGRRPAAGLVVRVVRVTVRRRHVVRWVAFRTRRVHDPSRYVGTRWVSRAGRRGRIDRWWRLTYHDGRLVNWHLVRSHRRPPRARIVSIGSKPRPAPPVVQVTHYQPPSSGGGLDWAALAQCESGGDPSIVDPPYYGLYQFTLGTWESVGGTGLPSDASASEQTYRARLLYERAGRSPWPVCGSRL